VSLAGTTPFGVLVPLLMAEHKGKFTAKPGAYFASDADIKVEAPRPSSCSRTCLRR